SMRSTGSTTWPSDISMGPRRSPTAASRSSGSPLPYSFSEERHHKGVSVGFGASAPTALPPSTGSDSTSA
ncbi:MAG: hypothetical protein V9G12_08295, partial [Microthrixaceae bacterium]